MNATDKRFKAALIDMDGVLYDTMPSHARAWQRMITELGIPCTYEEFFDYEGMTGVATIDLLFRRHYGHGVDPEEARSLYRNKARYFQEQGSKPMMPGTDRVLQLLCEKGLKRVLVTGSAQASMLDAIATDYPGAFEPGMRVTALDVTRGKPDPEPYLKGAALAGVDPSECIVIENAPLGVKSGVAAGCFVIAVMTGPIPREQFEQAGAHVILPDMQALRDYLTDHLNP